MEFSKQELSSSLLKNWPPCLAIAGSDSGGEAGIQADLKTFYDFNCHGLTAITACTAQNRRQIISLNEVPTKALTDQIEAVSSFFDPKFIKVGLLSSKEQIDITGKYTENKTSVIDPILKASCGDVFLSDEVRDLYREAFFKKGNIITPNFNELCWLLNMKDDVEVITLVYKAHNFAMEYKINFYLKGGHTSSPSTDFLITPKTAFKFEGDEIKKIRSVHGTGCRISSAICAALASGNDLVEACKLAKNYVYHTIKNNVTSNEQAVMNSPGKSENLQMKITYQEIQL